jgi:Tfp pilus assembly protein PilF
MQRREIWNYFTKNSLRFAARAAAISALAATCGVSLARAQFSSNIEGRATISGSVLLEGESQPASSVRVDVRTLTGAEVATTYTDSGGRFHIAGPQTDGYVVTIVEPGYEPVEQRVERTGTIAGIVLVLKKTRTFLPTHANTVSVHELKVPGKARSAFEKGLESLAKKDPQASLAHFKEATNAYPDYYEAFYQIGLVSMELRRGPEAEQALQRAIDLSGGGYAEPQFALGALLCEREAWTDAERVVRRAIDVDPNSWKGYFFLGQALFGENRLDDAEKQAKESLLRKSDAASAYILLANVHIRRHEYVMALNELDKYLALKPTGPTAAQARDVRAAAQRVVSRFQRILMSPQLIY